MTSMFDIMLSVFIGGMLIISMFTAMSTIQSHAINQKIAMTLLTNSRGYAKILKGYYLANIGIGHSGNPLISASSNSFRFWSRITDPVTGNNTDMDVTIGDVSSSGNHFLLVYRNGNTSLRLYGPFKLDSTGLQIRYYDEDDNLLTGSFSLSEIRSVEIGFYVESEGISLNVNTPKNITNYVYLKKYIINLYK